MQSVDCFANLANQPTPEDEAYKFGVQYHPACLVYVYRDRTNRKLTRYMIPLRNFNADSDCKSLARDIKHANREKLKPISVEKVESALRMLVCYLKEDHSNKPQTRNRKLFYVRPRIWAPEGLHVCKLDKLSKLSISD